MKRRLKKYFWSRPRALPRWWRMPDQFLLRYEVRWSIRWLTRWPGMFWLFFPLIFIMVCKLCRVLSDNHYVGHIASAFVQKRGTVFLIIIMSLWIWLLRHRTFVMFSRPRLEDLVLTRFTGRQLWPGLLAAPILIPQIIVMLSFVYKTAPLIIIDLIHSLSFESLRSAATLHYWVTGIQNILGLCLVSIIFVLIFLISFLAITALTAHVALKCHEIPTIPNIILAIFTFGCLMLIPMAFIAIAMLVMTLTDRFQPAIIGCAMLLYYASIIVSLVILTPKQIAQLRAIDMLHILRSRMDSTN